MCAQIKQEAQNPLILRCHRLMEAFAKSDDERDFYIDRVEGFLIYLDLDKPQDEINTLTEELTKNADRYCAIPKLSFYETKKIMEGFVNEKVYDIDTKEKLLEIIQSKEARENFLEFIYDHHTEQEKWQLFYQERSRIRIIEWLRLNHFHFVFEEDLDLPRQMIEKLKQSLFQSKAGKDIINARKILVAKAKTYYSNEALNPRPKRGRPPKQAIKPEIEPQVTIDIYTTVPTAVRPFLFSPEINLQSSFSIFSSKFDSSEDLLNKKQSISDTEASLAQKLASLRSLSMKWVEKPSEDKIASTYDIDKSFDDDDDDDEDDEDDEDDNGFEVKSKIKEKGKEKRSKAPVKANQLAKPKKTKEKSIPVKSKAVKPRLIGSKKLIAISKPSQKTGKVEKPKVKRIIPNVKKESESKKPQPLKKLLPKQKK